MTISARATNASSRGTTRALLWHTRKQSAYTQVLVDDMAGGRVMDEEGGGWWIRKAMGCGWEGDGLWVAGWWIRKVMGCGWEGGG
jgi:hypothetical protein